MRQSYQVLKQMVCAEIQGKEDFFCSSLCVYYFLLLQLMFEKRMKESLKILCFMTLPSPSHVQLRITVCPFTVLMCCMD